jgi:hypothetical protein
MIALVDMEYIHNLLVLWQNNRWKFLNRHDDIWMQLGMEDLLDLREDCRSCDEDNDLDRKVVWIAWAIFYKREK